MRTKKSIYSTSNAGAVWHKLPALLQPDASISSMFFIDDEYGWLSTVVPNESVGRSSGTSAQILVTKDGGNSWTEQNSFSSEVYVELTDIKFIDRQIGLAIGIRTSAGRPPYNEILAVVTSDGGRVWKDISNQLRALTQGEKIASLSTFGSSHFVILTGSGRVLSSDDLGKNWTATASFRDERPNGLVSSVGYYKVVHSPSGKLNIIAGTIGDEGHWGEIITMGSGSAWLCYELTRIPILDAVFTSDTEVFACGREIRAFEKDGKTSYHPQAVLLHSINAGQTWIPIYRANSKEAFISLSKVGDHLFYAVSDQGTLVKFSLAEL